MHSSFLGGGLKDLFFSFFLYKWRDGSDEGSNCVPACNSDFIFLVTDLDQKTAGSEPLRSLFRAGMEC